jgi:TatA/E family protein of Tat protein translocase
MSLGPAEILVILVIALMVFGPKRLPEVGRQVGSAMRELRRMQDSVKSELDTVLHPDVTPVTPPQTDAPAALEEPDHTTLPAPMNDDGSSPGSFT